MWGAILLFLGLVCLLTLFMHYSTSLASRAVVQRVRNTHETAMDNLDTKVPHKERKESPRGRAWPWRNRARTAAGKEEMTARRDRCLKELRKLIKYFRTTSLVENEEARAVLLEELGEIYDLWKDHWEDIERSVSV